MSNDKYPSIFSPQLETIVFIILQIFYATHAVLKIGGYLVNKPLQAAGMSADNREVKHDVYGKRQTAKMKLLPSVFSSLYSRNKIFVFAVSSKRNFSIFV